MNRVLLALQQIISDAVNAQINANSWPLQDIVKVFYGDPLKVPETNLPCIIIHPVNTDYIQRWSQYDQKRCSIEIRVVINRKLFFNDTWSPDDTVLAVQDMVERCEITNKYKATDGLSIAWIIEKNPCLKYTDETDGAVNAASLSKVTNVQYRFSGDRGFPTYEGVISILCDVVGDR